MARDAATFLPNTEDMDMGHDTRSFLDDEKDPRLPFAALPYCYQDANWNLIPEHMRAVVQRYIEFGCKPGSFLSAMVENDLRRAVENADAENVHALRNYVQFFYSYSPAECWGSPQKVKKWQEQHGLHKLVAKHDAKC